MTSRAHRVQLAMVVLLLALTGCSKRHSANIVLHPQWEYQNYHRVAVLPFQATRPKAAEAARQAEFMLVDLLAASGSFEVLTRGDLGDVFTEQDLSRLAGVADPATALPEGQVKVAEALIIGTITEFDLDRQKKERRVDRYARDRKGRIIRDRHGRPRVVGQDVYVEYRHVARVGGNVRVIDPATGRILLSHSVPAIENDDFQRGSPPRATPEALAEQVALEIGTEFYRRIAPQEIEVKVSSDCLVVAAEYYEGEYEKLKKVPVTLDEVLLVARDLPPECDRNNFRMTISSEDGREYLVEHEFTWSPSLGQRGETVAVPVARLLASGASKFTAKLFAVGNEEPITERDFELEEPKEEEG